MPEAARRLRACRDREATRRPSRSAMMARRAGSL